ncbi:MAG: hypothetical protein WCT51_04460 [Candidatus Shapirobacteria bacterium]|jgi:uncharacterized protein (UPF0332 family)
MEEGRINELEKTLKEAETLIKQSEKNKMTMYHDGVIDAIKALYYQNKVIIELLKEYNLNQKK